MQQLPVGEFMDRMREASLPWPEPGDYGKVEVVENDAIAIHHYVCVPNGLIGRLSPAHHVEEHDDNTWSVIPQPGNTNSIRVSGGDYNDALEYVQLEWHGYLRRGVWEDC